VAKSRVVHRDFEYAVLLLAAAWPEKKRGEGKKKKGWGE